MFWQTIANEEEENEIESKLKNPDCTLQMVLEDTYCLQEIKNTNEKLLAFFTREDIFRELIDLFLSPKICDRFDEHNYKLIHQSCEVLCIGVREFCPELIKHDDLTQKFVNYLKTQRENLNALSVSFYSRVVATFLSTDLALLSLLESGDFLAHALNSLEYACIFELLCSISTCSPDPGYRNRVKEWYVNKGFVNHLLTLFTPETPSQVVENAAMLWQEFIRSLRDFQYNIERCEDPLLESLQSEESVLSLLRSMFPNKNRFSPVIVTNGAIVLNALLETNNIKNSPSATLSQESQQQKNSIGDGTFGLDHLDSSSASSSDHFVIDSKRLVETKCAEYAPDIISCIITSIYMPIHENYGTVFVQSMQLLVNLLNTNFLPTHLELLKAFSSEETSMCRLFAVINDNPTRTIYNALLTSAITYILYSSTGEQRPLIDYLFKDFRLTNEISQALNAYSTKDSSRLTLGRPDISVITEAENVSQAKHDVTVMFGDSIESEKFTSLELSLELDASAESAKLPAKNENDLQRAQEADDEKQEVDESMSFKELEDDAKNSTRELFEELAKVENDFQSKQEEDCESVGVKELEDDANNSTQDLFEQLEQFQQKQEEEEEQRIKQLEDAAHNSTISPSTQSALYRLSRRAFFSQLAGRVSHSRRFAPNASYIDRLIKSLTGSVDDWNIYDTSGLQSTVSEFNRTIATTRSSTNGMELIVDEVGDGELQNFLDFSLD